MLTAALKDAGKRLQQVELPTLLFVLTVLLYLGTRFVRLPDFPIYFYSDEAVNTIRAADLLRDGGYDHFGTLLPTFFLNDMKFSLGTTVYLQVLPLLLFGKSVWATRAVSVLAGLLGVLWVGLCLRDVFKLRAWWAGALMLALAPPWFLLTRVAVEAPVAASFFAGFIYYYLLYRTRSPRFIYLAVILAALTFYSYMAGQIVIVATAALLAVSDWRYHWQSRRTLWKGLLLGLVLALPLVRFMLLRPDEYASRLLRYGSYLTENTSLGEKLLQFGGYYLQGLNPLYWLSPEAHEPIWWVMKGYSHLPWLIAPFTLIGLAGALRRVRQPEFRAVLLALLAAPIGAALVSIEITRVLVMLIPLALLSGLGFAMAVDWLAARHWRERWLNWGSFAVLALALLLMTSDALTHAPTWFTRYDMGGLQYGAQQVFTLAQQYQQENPQRKLYISSGWTWQSDVVSRFFLPDDTPIILMNADIFELQIRPEIEQITFVLTPEEYARAIKSDILEEAQLDWVMPYPDGQPGFYFVRLRYHANAEQVFAAKREKYHKLLNAQIQFEGALTDVRYSQVVQGSLEAALDGRIDNYVQSVAANPLVIEFDFPNRRTLDGVSAWVGYNRSRLTVKAWQADGTLDFERSREFEGANQVREVRVDFPQRQVYRLRVEVEDIDALEPHPTLLVELLLRP